MPSSWPGLRLRKRTVIAIVAVAVEIVAAAIWWPRRAGRRKSTPA